MNTVLRTMGIDGAMNLFYNTIKNDSISSLGYWVTDWGTELFVVDKDSSVPIYVQLVDRVEALVTVGALAAGDKLPSIRSVAEALRIDYNTVARAYAELDRAEVIKTARGVGTHVTGRLDQAALQQARRDRLHGTLGVTIRELLGLGYSAQEIQHAFGQEMNVSAKDGRTW